MRTCRIALGGRSLLALLALAPALRAQGELWTVGPPGIADFATIQLAVNAASDGDTILVTASTDYAYPSFVIDDKSLTLVGTTPGTTECGTIRIRNLSAGKRVTVRRLQATGLAASGGIQSHGAWLADCVGSVRFEECALAGRAQGLCIEMVEAGPGMEVSNCADVVLCAGSVSGGNGPGQRHAMHASNSRLALFGVDARGGVHSCGCAGGDGGEGLVLDAGSYLFASGGSIRGGEGASLDITCGGCAGDGGDGLVLQGGSQAALSQVVVQGGAGGTTGGWPPCDGFAGLNIVGGPVVQYGFAPRRLETPATLLEGQQSIFRFFGLPGDRAYLLSSTRAGFLSVPAWRGVLALHKPLVPGVWAVASTPPLDWGSGFLGIVPDSGVLEVPVVALDPGAAAGGILLQALAVDAVGNAGLGQPSHVVVLDSAVPFPDCNDNGVDDSQDVASGTSEDFNADGLPDECQTRVVHVDAGAPPGGDGASWRTAFRSLRDALTEPEPSLVREVWIAEGVYTPDPEDGVDRTVSFELRDGDRLFGGFAGHETSLDERDPVAHPTVLSGDLAADDAPGWLNRSDNTHRVVVVTMSAHVSLDGFTIRGGNATTHPNPGLRSGGGIATLFGILSPPRVLVSRVEFAENLADHGGAAYMRGDDLALVNCTFRLNRAETGGGLYLRCQDGGEASVQNSLFVANEAEILGAGARILTQPGSTTRVVGCTFASNVSIDPSGSSAGLASEWAGSIEVLDSILWLNVAGGSTDEEAQLSASPDADLLLAYSCVQGLASPLGPGNVATDPLFVDIDGPDGRAGTADDDLRLSANSPCADAGRNAYLRPDVADLDRDGDVDERVPLDLGLAARRVDDPQVPDTGSGDAPVVDMGAFERQVP